MEIQNSIANKKLSSWFDFGVIEEIKRREEAKKNWFGTEEAKLEAASEDQDLYVDKISLYVFNYNSSIRRWALQVKQHAWFNSFFLCAIVVNSVVLCLYDYDQRVLGDSYVSKRNAELSYVDRALTVVFIIECVLKVISLGLLFHRNAYLRDVWNCFDFLIIVVSLLDFFALENWSKLKMLRTLRILRPLRAINKLPQLKQLIEAIFTSARGLIGMIFFLLFTFLFFSIFGVQTFQGAQYNFCRTTEHPVTHYDEQDNLVFYDWPIVSTFPWLCNNDADCKHFVNVYGWVDQSEPIFKCGNSLKFKIKAGGILDIDNVKENANILYNFINYDNIANAMLTTYQVLSMQSWTDSCMYNYMDAVNKYVSAIFFVGIVILGGFFLMNVVLAQIFYSIDQGIEKQRRIDKNFALARIKGFKHEKSFSINKLERKLDEIKQKLDESDGDPHLTFTSAEADESKADCVARERSHKNRLFRVTFKLVTHWLFNWFITLVLLANIVMLACYSPYQSPDTTLMMSQVNIAFTAVFVVEMLLKFLGLGIKAYLIDTFNVFDGCIALLCMVELAVYSSMNKQFSSHPAVNFFKALRVLRVLRVAKIVRKWKNLRSTVNKMVVSLKNIGTFSLLLLLFLFVFSLLGMQLFAKYSFRDRDEKIVQRKFLVERFAVEPLVAIREGFDNIYLAANTLYLVIMNYRWNWIMYENLLSIGDRWPAYSVFFVVVHLVGSKVVFALFTAFLLQNFSENANENAKITLKKAKKLKLKRDVKHFWDNFSRDKWSQYYQEFKEYFGHKPRQQTDANETLSRVVPADPQNQSKISHVTPGNEHDLHDSFHNNNSEILILEGESLGWFGGGHRFRKFSARLVTHRWHQYFLLAVIGLQTVILALDEPLDNPKGTKTKVLNIIDFITTSLFTLETMTQVVAYGLFFNGRQSYLRNGWNVFSFLILVTSLVSISPSHSREQTVLKVLRAMRVLRPLLLIPSFNKLKITMIALLYSLPAIGSLFVLNIFFNFLLGILHTMLFGGLFWRCQTDHLQQNGSLSFDQIQTQIQTKWDCINHGGEWYNSDFNFDNSLQSTLVLTSIQTHEGWWPLMWQEVDGTAIDQLPRQWNHRIFILFSILVNLITNLVFMQLFVGVVMTSFKQNQDIAIGKRWFSKPKLNYIACQALGYTAQPVFKLVPTKHWSRMRQTAFKLCNHWFWEPMVQSLVMANTIFLCVTWYAQPHTVSKIVKDINYCFIAIGTATLCVTMFAFRLDFFRSWWRNLDFIVVLLSLFLLGVQWFGLGSYAVQLMVIRSFRLARLFRALRSTRILQVILKTMKEAASQLESISILLLILMYIFAVTGMKLFGFAQIIPNYGYPTTVNYHVNFNSFFNSFLMLIRAGTGEDWPSIMFDLSRQRSILFQCSDRQTYEDLVATNMRTNECGTRMGSFAFFMAYMILVQLIFLNLFTTVVVDAFVAQTQSLDLPVQEVDIEKFQDTWKEVDPTALGHIPCNKISKLLDLMIEQRCGLVPRQLYVLAEGKKTLKQRRKDYLKSLKVKVYNNWEARHLRDIPQVTFIDVLQAMIRERYKVEYLKERAQKLKVREKIINVLNSSELNTEDKTVLQKNLERWDQDREIDLEFSAFIASIDLNNAKYEVLRNLRETATAALKKVKRFDAMKNHPLRLAKLEQEYAYYARWATENKAVWDQKEKPTLSKEEYEEQIFNTEFTTYEYLLFQESAARWRFMRVYKRIKRERTKFQNANKQPLSRSKH